MSSNSKSSLNYKPKLLSILINLHFFTGLQLTQNTTSNILNEELNIISSSTPKIQFLESDLALTPGVEEFTHFFKTYWNQSKEANDELFRYGIWNNSANNQFYPFCGWAPKSHDNDDRFEILQNNWNLTKSNINRWPWSVVISTVYLGSPSSNDSSSNDGEKSKEKQSIYGKQKESIYGNWINGILIGREWVLAIEIDEAGDILLNAIAQKKNKSYQLFAYTGVENMNSANYEAKYLITKVNIFEHGIFLNRIRFFALKLYSPIKFTQKAFPVCLPQQDMEINLNARKNSNLKEESYGKRQQTWLISRQQALQSEQKSPETEGEIYEQTIQFDGINLPKWPVTENRHLIEKKNGSTIVGDIFAESETGWQKGASAGPSHGPKRPKNVEYILHYTYDYWFHFGSIRAIQLRRTQSISGERNKTILIRIAPYCELIFRATSQAVECLNMPLSIKPYRHLSNPQYFFKRYGNSYG